MWVSAGWPHTWKTWKSRHLRVVREKSGKIGKVRENVFLHALNLANWFSGKIIEIVAIRCQILRLKCTKFDFNWGSSPDVAAGACNTPPGPLARFKGVYFKGGEERNSELFHWSLLKNTAVIVVTVYMSIAVRNNMHFNLYCYCCEGQYSVNIHLKCLEKSGNFDNDWRVATLLVEWQ